jgi:uncharacterized membrane protein YeaQ/YmgE (transglycosylase-associated protein family)
LEDTYRETEMITFILSAILVGAVTGGLGRLLIPGRQDIGWRATILAGIVAAIVGTIVAHILGFADNTWHVLLVQLALAVVCVTVVWKYQSSIKGQAGPSDGRTDVMPLPDMDSHNRTDVLPLPDRNPRKR